MPDDISVVGFDDIPEAAYLIPPLTTVRQDFDAVGRRAIQILRSAIDAEGTPERLIEPEAGRPGQHHRTTRTRRDPPMSAGQEQYTIGVDYGTLSGRAVVVRVSDGAELGSAVHAYEHAVVDTTLPGTGEALPPEWALQVPEDYRQVLRIAVPAAVSAAGIDPAQVIGIATDFTACTMVPTLADGTPLCEVPELAGRPHAYVKLWKHHAAQPHADRINRLAEERGEAWLPRYGGLISSEWEFAKGLQLFEEDREVYDRMERWVEAADWIVWELCGEYVRNACSAGYKGILPGRRLPLDRLPRGARTRLRELRRRQAGAPDRPSSARSPAG